MPVQQQHASRVQFGQSLAEGLPLHSSGEQPQSAHVILSSMVFSMKIYEESTYISITSETLPEVE